MISSVFSILAAASPVAALVGTRIYSRGSRGQEVVAQADLPCVTFQTVGGKPENYQYGAPGIDFLRVQIDCWAATTIEANALYKVVRDALEAQGHIVSLNGDTYEPDTRTARYSFDWSSWESR